MERNLSIELCPVCKEPAHVTKKWVRNKSGKKYEYKLFHHNNTTHSVNENSSTLDRIRKDDARERLLELLNSTRFMKAIFTVRDIVASLDRVEYHMSYPQVRRTLKNFVDNKLISTIRKGRFIYFMNAQQSGRLNYLVRCISINLEDREGNGLFEKHTLKIKVLNGNSYPLSYLQYRAFGDNKRDKNQVSIKAFDISNNETASVYYLDDRPLEKRTIIEFTTPIPSGKERTFMIKYFWPEVEPSYTFSAATNLRRITFSLYSKKKFNLSIFETNSGRTVVEDRSSEVESFRQRNKLEVERFEDKNVNSFVILKFKWGPTNS